MSLAVDVANADELVRLVFEPVGPGRVRMTGGAGQEEVAIGEVPVLVAALFDLRPTLFEDRDLELGPAELDGLVADGLVRMLVLAAGEDDDVEPEAVVFDHQELGYFVVTEADGDTLSVTTVRSLDVWTIICGISSEVFWS